MHHRHQAHHFAVVMVTALGGVDADRTQPHETGGLLVEIVAGRCHQGINQQQWKQHRVDSRKDEGVAPAEQQPLEKSRGQQVAPVRTAQRNQSNTTDEDLPEGGRQSLGSEFTIVKRTECHG